MAGVGADLATGSRPQRVLFVCEGNLCRSPAAELLLRAARPAAVDAASAGLAARDGEPVARDTAALLVARGVDPSGFRSRLLRDDMVSQADLVVTMTAEQRSAVVERVPSALRRTWTLLDLAGTLRDSGLPLTAEASALQAARSTGHGDVADPWRRGAEAHRRSLALVSGAVGVMVESLRRGTAHLE